jgi:hypothetical protein
MIKFDLGDFVTAAGMIGTCGHTIMSVPSATFHKDDDERITAAIDLVCFKADEFGMAVTLTSANELKRMWRRYGYRGDGNMTITDKRELQRLSVEMKNVFDFAGRELSSRYVLMLSPKEADMIANREPAFGEEVFTAFSFAREDIEEAEKCLAFERGTAAVFHLMRALESSVQVIANKLGVAVRDDKGIRTGLGLNCQQHEAKNRCNARG